MRAFIQFFLGLCCCFFLGLLHAETKFKDIEQTLTDTVITTKITAKFAENKDLNPLKIRVSTHDGVVILKGHVSDKKAYVKALRIVKDTDGVKTVDIENLLIQPVNTALTDAYITAKVETAVLKAKVFDDESIPLVGINAKTVNGTVTLSGNVKSTKAALAIIKRVNNIRGVKKIISHLQVQPDKGH